MKKVVLLLSLLCCINFVAAQYQSGQGELLAGVNIGLKSLQDVYLNFEEVVFTPSDKKEIISSYLQLGKTQLELGHSTEAASLFKRAFDLAEDYYKSFPDEKNLYNQISDNCKAVLALLDLGSESEGYSTSSADEFDQIWNRPDADSVEVFPYLQHAIRHSSIKAERTLQSSSTKAQQEHKIVAAFFMAATEPIKEEYFTLKKRTSLRQRATHKSPVISRLASGTNLLVLEKTSKYWWKVRIEDNIGYVKALLLE